jgi:hypothetical protein
MPRTVKAVAGPQGGTKSLGAGRSMRIISGSMGAGGTPGTLDGTPLGDEKAFEAPLQSDSAWDAELRRREMSEGLESPQQQPAQQWVAVGRDKQTLVPTYEVPPSYTAAVAAARADQPDFSTLPDRFTLVVERKPDDWWKITAPESHVGLFIAHPNLLTALTDAPGALAQILRLDGPVPAAKRGRKTR